MTVWTTLAASLSRHGRAVMVTVVGAEGSSPRDAGARMVVHPDRSFTGTIGGGTLEWQAIELALARLAAEEPHPPTFRRFALGPELGQCCGGRVGLLFETFAAGDRETVAGHAAREAAGRFATRGVLTDDGVQRRVLDSPPADAGEVTFDNGVLIETFGDERRPLLLFGAGHVGRAIVLALAPLPFRITWLDPRADGFPAHHPANVEPEVLADPATVAAAAPADAFALVLTHSHQLDQAVVHALLAEGRFPFVGLIGSRTKRVRFVRRMTEAGLATDLMAPLVCPIGIPGIRSKAPAAIAAAVAAQLVERDEALRARERAATMQDRIA